MPYSYNWVNKGFLSKFLAPPGRSKSQQLVTISRHYRSHVGLKTGGRSYHHERVAAISPISPPDCNRQLRRIPLLGTSVNEPWSRLQVCRGPSGDNMER